MKYVNINEGYQIQILLPCTLLILKIIDCNLITLKGKYTKIITIVSIIIGIIGGLIFALFCKNYYLSFVWTGLFVCGYFFWLFWYKKILIKKIFKNLDDYRNDNFATFIFNIISNIQGIILIIIAFTQKFEQTFKPDEHLIVITVSKILYIITGLVYICCTQKNYNKYFSLK